jgi:hypothetical protein
VAQAKTNSAAMAAATALFMIPPFAMPGAERTRAGGGRQSRDQA